MAVVILPTFVMRRGVEMVVCQCFNFHSFLYPWTPNHNPQYNVATRMKNCKIILNPPANLPFASESPLVSTTLPLGAKYGMTSMTNSAQRRARYSTRAMIPVRLSGAAAAQTRVVTTASARHRISPGRSWTMIQRIGPSSRRTMGHHSRRARQIPVRHRVQHPQVRIVVLGPG